MQFPNPPPNSIGVTAETSRPSPPWNVWFQNMWHALGNYSGPVASASIVNLDAAWDSCHITGTTTITAVTLSAGRRCILIFDGVLTLTHHATKNNLPGGANITTAAGDRALYWSDGTTVYCLDYILASVSPVPVPAWINNTGASSDITLAVGQGAYVTYSGVTSVLLHITTADLQVYELIVVNVGNGNTAGGMGLNPNNTTYINFFDVEGVASSSTGPAGAGGIRSNFQLNSSDDPRLVRSIISTATAKKSIISTSGGLKNNNNLEINVVLASWQASASSRTVSDTTTAWTSLGTLVFAVAATGIAYVRRII